MFQLLAKASCDSSVFMNLFGFFFCSMQHGNERIASKHVSDQSGDYLGGWWVFKP